MAKKSGRNLLSDYSGFRVGNKSVQLKRDIVMIAKHEGVSYGEFLRRQIVKIRDAYPELEKLRKLNSEDDAC